MSGRNSPASLRARSGVRPLASGRAPALHALRVSHEQTYPFGFADCEADAAAFRRARGRFIQRLIIMPSIRFYVKELRLDWLIRKGGASADRGWRELNERQEPWRSITYVVWVVIFVTGCQQVLM
jgi:hypothetical protein